MSTLSVRLPDSVHRNARLYAEREGTSLNQLVATALAEKLAALGAEEYIRQRAERADDDAFEAALAAVPDVPPRDGD
ncbi:MAG: toxin-antitoxin system HicB family antitoxin [Thauera sp.]